MESSQKSADVLGGNADVEVAMKDDQVQPGDDQSTVRSPRGERGASLVEYALLLALISVVCIGALNYFGSSNGSSLNRSHSCIKAAHDGQPPPANC